MQSYTENIDRITAHLSMIRRELQREIAGKHERAHRHDIYAGLMSQEWREREDALKKEEEILEDNLHAVDTAIAALDTWER